VPDEKIKADIIGITGNRDYTDRAGLFRGLDRLQARQYIFGGARGADSDALEYIAKTQPVSTRVVVVPNRLGSQPVIAQQTTARYATEVIELKITGPDRYQIRNRYIVDHSNRVAAFTDGRKSGGTFNTIQYAESKGVPVDVQQMITFNRNSIMTMNNDEFIEWIGKAEKANVSRISIKGMVIEYVKGMEHGRRSMILKAFHRLRI